jgi:hypothetical protein
MIWKGRYILQGRGCVMGSDVERYVIIWKVWYIIFQIYVKYLYAGGKFRLCYTKLVSRKVACLGYYVVCFTEWMDFSRRNLKKTVGIQSVCRGVEHALGLVTRYYFLSECCCLVSVGLPLWREVGSAICHSQSVVIYQYLDQGFTFHVFYSSALCIKYIQSVG